MSESDDNLKEALLKKARGGEKKKTAFIVLFPPLSHESPSGFRSHFIRFRPSFCLALGWLSVRHKLLSAGLQNHTLYLCVS